MDVKLTFFDRISIPQMFPEKASFADGIIYDDIRNKIKITQEEITTYRIRNTEDGRGVEWDSEPEGGINTSFTDAETRLIVKSFIDLDSKAQVPTDPKFIALYRKFIN